MNKLFNLSVSHFRTMVNDHVSLDELYLLELLYNKENIWEISQTRVKILIAGLIRKDLINTNGLTESGLVYYNGFYSCPEQETALGKIIPKEDLFEKWWKEYPPNDGFKVGNMVFDVTRSLKLKKEECRQKFNRIVVDGTSAERLINALKSEVVAKKNRSLIKKENQLTYMPGTLPYLNGRKFEGFLDVEVRQTAIKDQNNNLTAI